MTRSTALARSRRVEPRHQSLLPLRARDPGRPRVDPIATTPIPRMRRSAVTSNRASAAKNHKMMLDHYQQTKNMLVSYSPKKLGFFLSEGLPLLKGVRKDVLGSRRAMGRGLGVRVRAKRGAFRAVPHPAD